MLNFKEDVIFLSGHLDFFLYSNVFVCLFDAQRHFHVGKDSNLLGYTYTQKDNKIWTGVLYVRVERRKPNEFEFILFSLFFTSVCIALGIIRDL